MSFSNHKYCVIGIMSGTSLDGIDLALGNFEKVNEEWRFDLIEARTYPYSKEWKTKLSDAYKSGQKEQVYLHKQYGKFLGSTVNDFLSGRSEKIDFISSHGHTIFHKPQEGITFQLGDGASIANTICITTISDFRSLDVSLGGQGAPLVPIGDELLFSEYDYCLNLGGFANISYNHSNKRLAYDVCPVNIIINHLTQLIGDKEMDKDGEIGRKGEINPDLLERLNSIDFYKEDGPKSLGREWLEEEVIPIIEEFPPDLPDLLRTLYEHVVVQIEGATKIKKNGSLLLTGGGAHNKFLVELIREKIPHKCILPANEIIDYKEALIFGFLGVLRFRNEVNCLSSVTGASSDNCGGVIFTP